MRNYERSGMTCHCINVDFGSYDNQVSMRLPFGDEPWICIDTCIATEIGWLWHQGVHTLNSCCGHQKIQGSVIVTPESDSIMEKLNYQFDIAPSGLRAYRLQGL